MKSFENEEELNKDFNHSEFDLNDGEIVFIDYGENGNWVFGILNRNTRTIRSIFDEDTSINNLCKRAVNIWGIDPHELWLSACGTLITVMQDNGMKV